MQEAEYSILSVEAALDVAETFLISNDSGRGVSEISRITGMTKNRVYRILNTLTKRGYIEKDLETSKYRLGPGFMVLGEAYRKRLDLRRVAEPLLRGLAEESGDAAHLAMLHGNQALVIDIHLGRHILQAPAEIGERIPLHIGAVPKIILAHMPEEQRLQILDGMEMVAYTQKTITNREVLESELRTIRAQGYYVSEDDYELGALSIGAPTKNQKGQAFAGLSLVIPKVRYSPERRQRIIELVIDANRRLSEKLGYREPRSGGN